MSHNIADNIKFGGDAFVSGNNIPAWHKLGTVKEGMLTALDCLTYGGLDFEVATQPAFFNFNGQKVVMESKYATHRTDNGAYLGCVGNKYKVVQNRDAFKFFDAITGDGKAIYETAGALGKGERIFISAKMPNYITINGTDDVTEFYVLFTSSHDGNGSIKAMVTPIRVVCANTLRMALENTVSSVNIRHTASAEQNLAQAHKILGITNNYAQEMDELMNHFNTIKVSDAKAMEIIAELFPVAEGKELSTKTSNLRDGMFEAYQTGTGQERILGTGYGLIQGVTYYTSHEKDYKDDSVKLTSLLEGQATKLVTQAKDLILSL